MKQKIKSKKDIGTSIKIDTQIYERLKVYCREKDIIMGRMAAKAIEEKLNSLLVETN
jgi:hypothetical protein